MQATTYGDQKRFLPEFVGLSARTIRSRKSSIDTRRVYVTGMSNGGFMSHRLGLRGRRRVRGEGHCWPGTAFCPFGACTTDINSDDEMWTFFQEFSLP